MALSGTVIEKVNATDQRQQLVLGGGLPLAIARTGAQALASVIVQPFLRSQQ